MTQRESTTTTPTGTSGAARATASPKAKPGMKVTVGTAVAAATLAAVTVLSGPAAAFAAPKSSESAASARIAGVQEDMARAVALRQITPEQAAFVENQLVKRISATA